MRSSDYALDFAEELSAKHQDFEYEVIPGRTYDKIVSNHRTYGGRGVHAFVVRSTGQLVKAATFRAPQKDKDGLAVRFDLSDPADAQRAVAESDPHGSYLYKR